MNQGVVLFASNNTKINYVKQAQYLAKRVRKYMDLPTSLVTDVDIKNKFPDAEDAFDQIIFTNTLKHNYANKRYHDGTLSNRILPFNNGNRADAYFLSPYDETLVMDTDYIICNDILNNCFSQKNDLCLYDDAVHLGIHNGTPEFKKISDTSVDFYWATVVFFRKTKMNEIYFNLVKHIQENYMHYRSVYQFKSNVYRNDFAFSIAAHIMNGYQKGNIIGNLPGKHFYSIDKDLCHNIKDDEIVILLEKSQRLGEYTLTKTKGMNIHVMNKFSLERVIDNK
tara:strand:- start:301 stop:1143 length:843 start_codon:yes stop_codon:yes gene_type:complete